MFGLGAIAKLAKGGIGPDELASLCEAAGMNVEFTDVPMGEARAAFGVAGASLTRPGARLVRISGAMKGGDRMEALIILVPASKVADIASKKRLTAAAVTI